MIYMSDADWRAMDEACHADAHRFRLWQRRDSASAKRRAAAQLGVERRKCRADLAGEVG
jgi:hypothetical protein